VGMMNVLGERDKEKPCKIAFTRLFSSLDENIRFWLFKLFSIGLGHILPC